MMFYLKRLALTLYFAIGVFCLIMANTALNTTNPDKITFLVGIALLLFGCVAVLDTLRIIVEGEE